MSRLKQIDIKYLQNNFISKALRFFFTKNKFELKNDTNEFSI